MATARSYRSRTSQPELPLLGPPGTATDGTGGGPVTEWRLDEHTRMVGRQGIAAARAGLAGKVGPRAERIKAADHQEASRAA